MWDKLQPSSPSSTSHSRFPSLSASTSYEVSHSPGIMQTLIPEGSELLVPCPSRTEFLHLPFPIPFGIMSAKHGPPGDQDQLRLQDRASSTCLLVSRNESSKCSGYSLSVSFSGTRAPFWGAGLLTLQSPVEGMESTNSPSGSLGMM